MDRKAAREGYVQLTKALAEIGFTQSEMDDINRVLAIVLHFGNVLFTQDEESDSAHVVGYKPVIVISKLVGCDSDDLVTALTTNVTVTRGESIVRRLGRVQAEDCRDATAKAIYGRLFKWLVYRINDFLAPRQLERPLEVGILDIFGFENFERNRSANT
jgi:myosin heavy subunit